MLGLVRSGIKLANPHSYHGLLNMARILHLHYQWEKFPRNVAARDGSPHPLLNTPPGSGHAGENRFGTFF